MSNKLSLQSRENNISVMRWIAAILVIFSHSYPLTGNGVDWIQRSSGDQISFGGLAVTVFFFYGGFLISKSVERRKGDFIGFLRSRCSRIFPALWVVVLLSVFCMGPLLTILPFRDYITDGATWKYLLNGLLIPIHPLPGVFESNPYPAVVNGSLWTLPVEFLCYLFCYVFSILSLTEKKKPVIATGTILLLALFVNRFLPSDYYVVHSAIRRGVFFLLGMFCYIHWDRIPRNRALFWLLTAVLIVSIIFGFVAVAVYFTVPYILIYLAFGKQTALARWCDQHEISYGIYLVAFPLQQTVVWFFPELSQAVHILICIPLAIFVGYLLTVFTDFVFRLSGRMSVQKRKNAKTSECPTTGNPK